MSEIAATLKIHFNNESSAKKFLKLIGGAEKTKDGQQILKSVCKKLLVDIDDEILMEEPWSIEYIPTVDNELHFVMEYTGSDDEVFQLFCTGCIQCGACQVFSVYREDHTGEFIFTLNDQDGNESYEQTSDFSIDTSVEEVGDLAVLNLLESLYRDGFFIDKTPTKNILPEGDLSGGHKLKNGSLTFGDYREDRQTYIYSADPKSVYAEEIIKRLKKNGWSDVFFATYRGKPSRSKGLPHEIIATKEPAHELVKIMKNYEEEDYYSLVRNNEIGIVSCDVYEKWNFKEYMLSELGEEEYAEACATESKEFIDLAHKMKSMYTLSTFLNQMSDELGYQLYAIIGELTQAIEYDWKLKKFCVVR